MIKRGGGIHRYSALLILLIAVYLLSTPFIYLWNKTNDVKHGYENSQLQLKKYQAMVATLPQLQADNKALLAMTKNDSRYLTETSSSLAVAGVQKKLQQSIQQSGAKLISMQAINTKAEAGFSPIKMQLHLRLTNEALLKLLHQLESQNPTGFVYDLQIQRQAGISRNRQTLGKTLLDLRFAYTVFMVNVNDS